MFFSDTVKDNDVEVLSGYVTSHGGTIAQRIEDASHVIVWDEEVDGSIPDEIIEEFIRPIDIRFNASNDRLALVHWWYHPDSYDEWIPAEDVDFNEVFETQSLTSSNENSNITRQWFVCCRFLRDLEVFNEWGNELDYEIDYLDKNDSDTNATTTVTNLNINSKTISTTASTARGRKPRGRLRKPPVKRPNSAAPLIQPVSVIPEALLGTERWQQDASPPTDDTSRESCFVIEVGRPSSNGVCTYNMRSEVPGELESRLLSQQDQQPDRNNVTTGDSTSEHINQNGVSEGLTSSTECNHKIDISADARDSVAETKDKDTSDMESGNDMVTNKKEETQNSLIIPSNNAEISDENPMDDASTNISVVETMPVFAAKRKRKRSSMSSTSGDHEEEEGEVEKAESEVGDAGGEGEVEGEGDGRQEESASNVCIPKRSFDESATNASDCHMEEETRQYTLSYPDWFVKDQVAPIEVCCLPEFFNNSSCNRTMQSYITLRTLIMNIYERNPEEYLSATVCRRRIAGDVCTIIRVHEFMDAFGLINQEVKHECRPPLTVLPPKDRLGSIDKVLPIYKDYVKKTNINYDQNCSISIINHLNSEIQKQDNNEDGIINPNVNNNNNMNENNSHIDDSLQLSNSLKDIWTKERDLLLLEAVSNIGFEILLERNVEQESLSSYWSQVAEFVGGDVTAQMCLERFVCLPLPFPKRHNRGMMTNTMCNGNILTNNININDNKGITECSSLPNSIPMNVEEASTNAEDSATAKESNQLSLTEGLTNPNQNLLSTEVVNGGDMCSHDGDTRQQSVVQTEGDSYSMKDVSRGKIPMDAEDMATKVLRISSARSNAQVSDSMPSDVASPNVSGEWFTAMVNACTRDAVSLLGVDKANAIVRAVLASLSSDEVRCLCVYLSVCLCIYLSICLMLAIYFILFQSIQDEQRINPVNVPAAVSLGVSAAAMIHMSRGPGLRILKEKEDLAIDAYVLQRLEALEEKVLVVLW